MPPEISTYSLSWPDEAATRSASSCLMRCGTGMNTMVENGVGLPAIGDSSLMIANSTSSHHKIPLNVAKLSPAPDPNPQSGPPRPQSQLTAESTPA